MEGKDEDKVNFNKERRCKRCLENGKL